MRMWLMAFLRRIRLLPSVEFLPQMEMTECGAACLRMIMAFHGHYVPMAELRVACNVSRDGSVAADMLEAAESYGFEAVAVQVALENLEDLVLPAILHWEFNHFVVLEGLDRKNLRIVDPAIGKVEVARQDAMRKFTGVAMMFAPDDETFRPRPKVKPSLKRYFSLFRLALPSLGLILAASLSLEVIGLIFPVSAQILVDHVITPKRETWLYGLAALLVAATIGKTAVRLAREWTVQVLQRTLDLHLLSGFMDHLLTLPISFFLQRRPGELMQRLSINGQIRSLLASQSVSFLLDGFLLVGYLFLAFVYCPKLALIVVAVSLARWTILMGIRRRNRYLVANELMVNGREGAALVEAFTGLETTKASGAEFIVVDRWYNRVVDSVNVGLLRRTLEMKVTRTMGVIHGLAMAIVYLLGAKEVMAGRMTLGVFMSFNVIQGLFMSPFESLMDAISQIQYLGMYLERLDDVLETPAEPRGTLQPGRLQGSIELQHVTFKYARKGRPAIRDISLTIAPGEKIALVGATGAGKSTLARILLGMHLPDQGRIMFDGVDLREYDLSQFRNQMGVVLQETFLFNDTVLANLTLNDDSIPFEKVRDSARLACAEDIILQLEDGYETKVGPNGNRLSGGQRQRLNLARALAHDPAILVLDEATSSLDLALEKQVHQNLASLGCTRVIIAHRLATVMDADRILVMEDGRLVQEGTYDSLSSQPGPFRTLVTSMEATHA